MFQLVTLGRTDLQGPAPTRPERLLSQPKRFALLVYLTIEGRERALSRESLLLLLWPNLDQSRARDALRQAIRFVRSTLHPDTVAGHGRDRVGVAPESIRCDAWDFERLLDEGKREEALALYGGPLLPGLHVSGAPAFEQWLAGARARLLRRATEAAWSLAEDARDRDDAREALRWARSALAIAPDDEDGVRRLIGMLGWSGDRAGAKRAYEEFAERLRADLGVEPSRRTRELVERVLISGASPPLNLPLDPQENARSLDSGEPGSSSTSPSEGHGAPSVRPEDASSGSTAAAPPPGPVRRPGAARPPRRKMPSRRAILAVLGLTLSLALGGAAYMDAFAPDPVDLPSDRIAIVPFRVGGADPSLGYLGEGVVDLLGAHFTGDVGPRALSPRVVLQAWENTEEGSSDDQSERALRIAHRLDAGRVLTGHIVGNERRIIVHAVLHAFPGGKQLRASVNGPTDSLHVLAGQLATRLLALELGKELDHTLAFDSVPSEAVRAYLRGAQEYRRGAFAAADRSFERALRMDSTFALAAVGLVHTRFAAPWIRGHVFESAIPLAWRLRERLGPADRAFVIAAAGPNYPYFSSGSEAFQAWARVVAESPDRPESWFHFGDALFHWGRPLGIADHQDRATRAFERALDLDPSLSLPLAHLVDLAAEAGDTARVRRYGEQYLRQEDPADVAGYVRWRMATALGDTAALRELRTGLEGMPFGSLLAILKVGQTDAFWIEDAELAGQVLLRRSLTPAERWHTLFYLRALALNRGQPGRALRLTEQLAEVEVQPRLAVQYRIPDALFENGDRDAAVRAVAALSPSLHAPLARSGPERQAQFADICVVELWRIWHRQTATALPSIQRLRVPPGVDEPDGAVAQRLGCAAMLEMLLASVTGSSELAERVRRYTLLFDAATPLPAPLNGGSFVLARVLEEQGDVAGALRAVERMPTLPMSLASMYREQGRLATLLGDSIRADAAYRRYLALRTAPEPGLRREVHRVEAALRHLTARPGSSARSGSRSGG